MKCIAIQINMSRDTAFDEDDFLRLVKSIGRFPEIDRDEQDNALVQFNFFTEDPPLLWQALQTQVLEDADMGAWVRAQAVIACEGDQGWDDMKLLFHYDANEKCDSL